MPKYYDTAEFKKLNARWQKKLKNSGFDDIEKEITLKGEGGNKKVYTLKTWSFSLFRGRFDTTAYEAKNSYYRMAVHFLHSHIFRNALEKTIWKKHSEGMSYDKIDNFIQSKKGKARRTIEPLAVLMKLKAAAEND